MAWGTVRDGGGGSLASELWLIVPDPVVWCDGALVERRFAILNVGKVRDGEWVG